MARAQVLFGDRMRVVSAAFTVLVTFATARIWVARIRSRTLLMRATSFTMFVVAVCVTVLCATRSLAAVSGSGAVERTARTALPWGMSLLFLLFALVGLLRGFRSLSHDLLYAILLMLVATGGLYGSYRAVFSTVLAGKHFHLAARDRNAVSPGLTNPNPPKQPGSDDEQQDVNAMQQRHEIGASEAEDLKTIDDIANTRTRNQAALEKKLQPTAAP
jgi:hypothetical protein